MLTRLRGSRSRSRAHDDRGAVTVVVVLFLVVFLILLAFVVDFGRQYVAKGQMQNAVDAAALAAGLDLCDATSAGAVQARAQTYAAQNGVTIPLSAAQVSLGTEPRWVRVTATGGINTTLGRVAGVTSLGVSAIAKVNADCKIKKFGLYADQVLTINGAGTSTQSTYAGDVMTPNGSGITISYLQTDPGGVVAPGATIGTLDQQGVGKTAQQYAYIFPTKPDAKKLDALVDTPFDATVGLSFVDEKSATSGSPITACGTNPGSTKNALNGAKGGRFVCAGQVTTAGVDNGFTGSISSQGVIDLAGPGVITFNPKLLYSTATGDAIKVAGVIMTDCDSIIYAPNGNVLVNSSGNSFCATVIAKNITFNGSKQLSTAEGSDIPGGDGEPNLVE